MSLPQPQSRSIRSIAAISALALGATGLVGFDAAVAHDPLQTLLAPFSCGTEWAGVTRSGHGLNDWNLDINRTSRTFDDPDHDLGQPLLAQADGIVVYLAQDEYNSGAGAYLEIDYGDLTVRYIHLVEHSIPPHLDEIGAAVSQGELIGLLGDSGNASHAHLHLEYFDSVDFDDTPWWQLPKSNQVQIAMDGEPIDPGEAFTSTNCDAVPPPTSTTIPNTTTTTTLPRHPFIDVDPDSFADEDISTLFAAGITTGTTDTTYSPADHVTREQIAAFLARTWRMLDPDLIEVHEPLPFGDVDPHSFAHDDIHLLVALDLTTGTSATEFSPAAALTREQMAALLARFWRKWIDPGVDPMGDEPSPFADVDPDSFAFADIELLWQLGLTTGTSPISYSPADTVTREQMAAFLARLIRLLTTP